jgi:hypothetical protein
MLLDLHNPQLTVKSLNSTMLCRETGLTINSAIRARELQSTIILHEDVEIGEASLDYNLRQINLLQEVRSLTALDKTISMNISNWLISCCEIRIDDTTRLGDESHQVRECGQR